MISQFALLDLGTPELVIILAIVLLLFGGKKLPQLSRSLGESMKEIRKGLNGDLKDSDHNETKTTEKRADKDAEA
jgi:sec-independent protein translocase protein TatA